MGGLFGHWLSHLPHYCICHSTFEGLTWETGHLGRTWGHSRRGMGTLLGGELGDIVLGDLGTLVKSLAYWMIRHLGDI